MSNELFILLGNIYIVGVCVSMVAMNILDRECLTRGLLDSSDLEGAWKGHLPRSLLWFIFWPLVFLNW